MQASEPKSTSTPFRLSVGYLLTLFVIYGATSCAWMILGTVTQNRTNERDSELRNRVGQIWGGEHSQVPPSVTLEPPVQAKAASKPEQASEKPEQASEQEKERRREWLEPLATQARAKLALEHRRKGLLWYSTYAVTFAGSYQFKNPHAEPRIGRLCVPLPARSGASYDEFAIELNGQNVPFTVEKAVSSDRHDQQAVAQLSLPQGVHTVRVGYASRGLDRWEYALGSLAARARNFSLVVHTNFAEIDFPQGSLAPSQKRRTSNGWELGWHFQNLLSDASIALLMPKRINPGPLAAEIAQFAPISLGFFFLVLLLVCLVRQIKLHPMHFAMLAAAFFSFHLLMAYLVDHVPLGAAFALSSLISVGLVVSYLRLIVGSRFALLWAGGAQLLYLVLFSLAFFLEGYTGLTVTIFSVLTLFVIMQLTARIDWATKFGPSLPPPPRVAGSVPSARVEIVHAPVPREAEAAYVRAETARVRVE